MDPLENVPGQVIPVASSSRLVTIVAPALIALQLLMTVLIYPFLPDNIPSHWNATGQINSYSSRWVYAGIMPAISIGLYVFLLIIFMAISSASSSRSPEELRVGQNILKVVMLGQQVLFLLIQAVLLIIALHARRGAVG